MCDVIWSLQEVKLSSRWARADKMVVKEEKEEDHEEDEQDVFSSGERDGKEKELKKDGKKEKDESFDFKDIKESKEKKEIVALQTKHRQEEGVEKVREFFQRSEVLVLLCKQIRHLNFLK